MSAPPSQVAVTSCTCLILGIVRNDVGAVTKYRDVAFVRNLSSGHQKLVRGAKEGTMATKMIT